MAHRILASFVAACTLFQPVAATLSAAATLALTSVSCHGAAGSCTFEYKAALGLGAIPGIQCTKGSCKMDGGIQAALPLFDSATSDSIHCINGASCYVTTVGNTAYCTFPAAGTNVPKGSCGAGAAGTFVVCDGESNGECIAGTDNSVAVCLGHASCSYDQGLVYAAPTAKCEEAPRQVWRRLSGASPSQEHPGCITCRAGYEPTTGGCVATTTTTTATRTTTTSTTPCDDSTPCPPEPCDTTTGADTPSRLFLVTAVNGVVTEHAAPLLSVACLVMVAGFAVLALRRRYPQGRSGYDDLSEIQLAPASNP